MKDLYFSIKNQKLKATLFYPKDIKSQNPGVIFINGWATDESHQTQRAEAVAAKGAICLTFDMRGNGLSDEEFTAFSREDHLQDTIASYDFLISQKEIDKNKIGVCGISYGGYLATLLSTERDIQWLVLRSPALYPDAGFTEPTAKLLEKDPRIFSQSGIDPNANRALIALERFKGNILFVESEHDSEVIPTTAKNYMEVLQHKEYTHYVIKNADHLSTDSQKQEFIEIMSNWFAQQFAK